MRTSCRCVSFPLSPDEATDRPFQTGENNREIGAIVNFGDRPIRICDRCPRKYASGTFGWIEIDFKGTDSSPNAKNRSPVNYSRTQSSCGKIGSKIGCALTWRLSANLKFDITWSISRAWSNISRIVIKRKTSESRHNRDVHRSISNFKVKARLPIQSSKRVRKYLGETGSILMFRIYCTEPQQSFGQQFDHNFGRGSSMRECAHAAQG